MPIYTFHCEVSNTTFEEIVAYDTQEAKCPVCECMAKRSDVPEVPAKRNPSYGIQG